MHPTLDNLRQNGALWAMRHLVVALLLAAALLSPGPAAATVTTSTRTVSYSPAVDTPTFAVTFPFTERNQITMTKVLEATGVAVSPFVQGTHYNVYLPAGSTNGYVTTTSPVTSAYTVTITRTTPLTQTTSLVTQGPYSASSVEKALDKLTFERDCVQISKDIEDDVD